MKVSFEFNDGENASQMVAAIVGLFGATIGSAPALSAQPQPTGAADGGDDNEPENTNAPAFDKDGLPWDARIHSKSKALTDKGVWRKQRNVPAALLESVTAELKARAGQPVAQAPAAAAPTAAPLAPPALPNLSAPPLPPAPAAAPIAPRAFDLLVSFLAANTQSPTNPNGRLDEAYISNGLKGWGVVGPDGNGSLQSLAHADDTRVKTVHNAFAQVLGLPGVV